jgi:hypothetical protein
MRESRRDPPARRGMPRRRHQRYVYLARGAIRPMGRMGLRRPSPVRVPGLRDAVAGERRDRRPRAVMDLDFAHVADRRRPPLGGNVTGLLPSKQLSCASATLADGMCKDSARLRQMGVTRFGNGTD